ITSSRIGNSRGWNSVKDNGREERSLQSKRPRLNRATSGRFTTAQESSLSISNDSFLPRDNTGSVLWNLIQKARNCGKNGNFTRHTKYSGNIFVTFGKTI